MNAQTAAKAADKPRMSALLAQVATVARISTSSLGLRRLDKEASAQSDRAHNAKAGTGKTTASRLSGAEDRVKAISDKATEARNALIGMTTTWGDYRLLANVNIQNWLKVYAPLKAEYDQLVRAIVQDAPLLIAQAETNKGTFNVAVPTEDEIRDAFSMEFSMQQIPDSQSFTASGVNAEVEAQMRRHFEANIESAYAAAQADAVKRVAEPLQHLAERFKAFDKGDTKRLYATTMTNLQDIARVFRSFNLTNDPLLSRVADRLDAFDGIEIEDVKASPDLRKDLTKKAEVIMNEIRDLI